MKKFVSVILFLFSCQLLFAQPRIDSVRVGIKSMKHKVCGYSGGDSTKLILEETKFYDKSGKKTIQTNPANRIPMDWIDDPESSAFSMFYDEYSMHHFSTYDTIRFKYDAKGNLIEEKGRSNGTYDKTVYAFDGRNNCISEKYYRNGKLFCSTFWTYDTLGNKLTKSFNYAGVKPKVDDRYSYDYLGRLLTEENLRSPDDPDKSIYSYSLHQKTMQNEIHFSNWNYDEQDSLISFVSGKKYGNKRTVSDSNFYFRNAKHQLISISKFEYSDYGNRSSFEKYDEHRNLILKNFIKDGDTLRTEIWNYNSEQKLIYHTRFYENTLKEEEDYYYNELGDLIEKRLLDGKGNIVQRDVYEYKYY